MDYTVGSLNPYATTPPQELRILLVPHELQLSRVDADTWIHFCVVSFIQCNYCFICQGGSNAFSRNFLVEVLYYCEASTLSSYLPDSTTTFF